MEKCTSGTNVARKEVKRFPFPLGSGYLDLGGDFLGVVVIFGQFFQLLRDVLRVPLRQCDVIGIGRRSAVTGTRRREQCVHSSLSVY